jgi:hypothetical protein
MPKVSSGFHSSDRPGHDGVDIMYKRLSSDGGPPGGAVPHSSPGHFMPSDIPALAFGAGVVTTSKEIGTGGYVVIDHPNGLQSQYMHLFNRRVKVGDKVSAGDQVGDVGYNVSGYKLIHLHFQIRRNGTLVDPAPLIAGLPVVDAPGGKWVWLLAGGAAIAAGVWFSRYVR